MTLLHAITITVTIAATISVIPVVILLVFLVYKGVANQSILSKINLPAPNYSNLLTGTFDLTQEYLDWAGGITREFGNIVKIRIFHLPVILITEPEEARAVLSTANLYKGAIYKQVSILFGPHGLVAMNHGPHSKWKSQRTLLNQAFKVGAIRSLQGIFDRHAQAFADHLESKVDQEIDFCKEVIRITLDIISEIIGAEKAPDNFMNSVVAVLSQLGSPLLTLPYGGYILRYVLYRRHMAVIDSFIYKTIHEKRAERAQGKLASSNGSMLDLLVDTEDEETGQRFTDEEIRDHLFTFFIAGYETTGSTLSWLVYNLATNPDIEARLLEEVDAFPFPLEHDSLRKLTYMQSCLDETLRMYPPVMALTREAPAPFQMITQPTVTLPSSVSIMTNIYGLHHDERFWNEPLKFDPSRWESDEPRRSHTYLPFSAGPRICIGKGLFFAEATTVMLVIYKKLRFDLVPGVKTNGVKSTRTGVLKPENVRVYARRRQNVH